MTEIVDHVVAGDEVRIVADLIEVAEALVVHAVVVDDLIAGAYTLLLIVASRAVFGWPQ